MKRLNKFQRWFLDLLLYAICYGIGLLIAQYISIPDLIYYLLFLLLGLSAVIFQVNPKYLHKLRYIPLLQAHFSWMYRINRRVGQSVQEGKLKSAFKFTLGMIYIALYCFWMNILLISLKWLINLTINTNNPLHFQEAFLALFGSGVGAYIYWLIIFHRDTSSIKAQMITPAFKMKMSGIGQTIKIGLKIYTISQAYLIWILAEFLFLLGSPAFWKYIWDFTKFIIGFYIFLLIILLLIFIITKPKFHPPKADINFDNSGKDENSQ